MPRSTRKTSRVVLTAIFAMLFLAVAVSAQAFEPRSEKGKQCNAKYDECLKSCTVKAGCTGPCGAALLKCVDASETPKEKANDRAFHEKEQKEYKEAVDAAKFNCEGDGKTMVIYATNNTHKILRCDVHCEYADSVMCEF